MEIMGKLPNQTYFTKKKNSLILQIPLNLQIFPELVLSNTWLITKIRCVPLFFFIFSLISCIGIELPCFEIIHRIQFN